MSIKSGYVKEMLRCSVFNCVIRIQTNLPPAYAAGSDPDVVCQTNAQASTSKGCTHNVECSALTSVRACALRNKDDLAERFVFDNFVVGLRSVRERHGFPHYGI